MNVEEKYRHYRNVAKDGDILVFRGTSLLARLIRFFDDGAYYNHTGVVYWNRGRLEMIDAWYGGVEKVPASKRVRQYRKGDFCVIRPSSLFSPGYVDDGLMEINKRWQAETKYHYLMLLRIALIKKTGIDLTRLSKRTRTICSFLTRDYTNEVGIECYKYLHLITPHDFVRHADEDEVKILFHDK